MPSNAGRWLATLDKYRTRIQKLAWEFEHAGDDVTSKKILAAIDEETEEPQEGKPK